MHSGENTMKHIVAHHSFGTPQGTLGRGASGLPWSIRVALVKAAAVVRRFPSAPSRSARSDLVGVPVRPKAVDRRRAGSRVTATHWEGQEMRGLSRVEGLMLAVLMAYFGTGLVAILGGL
jgi:hypothetical protein